MLKNNVLIITFKIQTNIIIDAFDFRFHESFIYQARSLLERNNYETLSEKARDLFLSIYTL